MNEPETSDKQHSAANPPDSNRSDEPTEPRAVPDPEATDQAQTDRQAAAQERRGSVSGWELYLVIALSSILFAAAIAISAFTD